MAPGEVSDESIIANGVGQAPDAFAVSGQLTTRLLRSR
jgi:hypothetical protein